MTRCSGRPLVVVPSRDPVAGAAAGIEAATGAGLLAAAEEQLLVLLLLLLLRKPRARLIYCSSQAIQPSIIDYYLGLLPGVIPSHARARLLTVPVYDATARPLTRKILDRPRVIERLSHLISDTATTHIVPATPSRLERDLALWLGIPVFGADPSFLRYCEAATWRQLCDQLGIAHVATAAQAAQQDERRRASVQLRINPLAVVELQSTHDPDSRPRLTTPTHDPDPRPRPTTAHRPEPPRRSGPDLAGVVKSRAFWGERDRERQPAAARDINRQPQGQARCDA